MDSITLYKQPQNQQKKLKLVFGDFGFQTYDSDDDDLRLWYHPDQGLEYK